MRLAYFISNFIPVSIAIIYIWRNKKLSKKVITILVVLGSLGLINALAENPALRWGIWDYNPETTLGVTTFGVLFETYIYCFLVPIAIGSAALVFAQREDMKRNGRHKAQ